MNLGQVYLLDGKLEKAKAAFLSATPIDDEDGEAYLALANVAYLQGRKDVATTYLDKIPPWSSKLPDSYSGASKMAQVFDSRLYLEDGRDDLAVAALEKIGNDSEDSLAHYLLWLSYGLSGNKKEATIRSEYSDRGRPGSRTEEHLALKQTLDVVWLELWERCGIKDGDRVTEWGTKK